MIKVLLSLSDQENQKRKVRYTGFHLTFLTSYPKPLDRFQPNLAQSILGGLQKTHSAQKPFGQLQEHVVLIQVQTNRDPQGYDRATMVS